MRMVDVATSLGASIARMGAGLKASAPKKRPAKPLELYEFEACPFCRKVRDAITELDLEAMIYPCPKNGKRFRSKAKKLGGKEQFPYLVDPNTGKAMYESDGIVRYLFETYGGRSASLLLTGPFATLSSQIASVWRPIQGSRARASHAPKEPLELYSFEASPFCRIVRETLCELELPYLLHNVGKKSPSRKAFVKRSGKMQVPYLVDPNKGKAMFESADIKAYLLKTYGA
ncbi:MAG: hypothetical protein A2Y95_06785 [Deltaproteobacteria bacterium RBG_13_65_10]|nr:MAG: hypothetical protein A2Y95_06785 [Deltaproteobacteria bacterium RBG_13_65_10]